MYETARVEREAKNRKNQALEKQMAQEDEPRQIRLHEIEEKQMQVQGNARRKKAPLCAIDQV